MTIKLIDLLVIISLLTFYTIFLVKTALLYRKGVKVWVIGSSAKRLFEKILENILFPVLVVWSIFIVVTALHINLPSKISNLVFNISFAKYVGIAFCYFGLFIFLSALVSFGKA
jgi:O-antigen ligase